MMTSRPRAGRPTLEESAALEDRLRQAALDSFVAHGFDGTTMEAVAAAAGVTKPTLYARYPDKRTLFAKVVPWAMSRMQGKHVDREALSDDLEEALRTIGRAAVARVIDPEMVQLRRIAMMESASFPEFADAAHSLTWSPRLRIVLELLLRHVESGDVKVDNAELAAEHFLAMVSGFPAILADFGVIRDPDDEERHVDHAVALFLNGVRTDSA